MAMNNSFFGCSNRRSPETDEGVDGGAWEGMINYSGVWSGNLG